MATKKNRINAFDVAAVLVAFTFPAMFLAPSATATDESSSVDGIQQRAQDTFETAQAFEETAAGSPLKFTYSEPSSVGQPGAEWTTFINADGSIPSSIGSQRFPSTDPSIPIGAVRSEFCVTFNPEAGGECYVQNSQMYALAPMLISPWEPLMIPTTSPLTDRPEGISVVTAQVIGGGSDYDATVTGSTFTLTARDAMNPDAAPVVMTWQIVDPSDVPAMPQAPAILQGTEQAAEGQ